MRWRGLAKAGLQSRFTAIVYNVKGIVKLSERRAEEGDFSER
jgi:hypothetical protein